jgi:hypothetical protein
MKASKPLSQMTVAEVKELAQAIEVTTRTSYFRAEGPQAWPGGGESPSDFWYYTNECPEGWTYSKEPIELWFFTDDQYIHYICEGTDGELIQVRWDCKEI